LPRYRETKLLIESGKVSRAEVQGAVVDPAKSYRMAINNFVASGGDGYPKMTQHRTFVDSGFVDAEVLRAFVGANSPIKVADYAPQHVVQRR